MWDAALIAIKTTNYAATLGAAGAALFLGYGKALLESGDRLRIRRIILALALASVIASVAQIVVSAGSLSGDAAGMVDGSILSMVWQAGAIRCNSIRAAGLLLMALGVSSDRASWLAYVGAVMAATSFAWIGHAASLRPEVLPVVSLSVHLAAVAFWTGALLPLLVVSRSGDLSRTAATAARFGSLALLIVGGLIAAGLVLLSMLLGGVTKLWSSAYGGVMTVKLGLVACLLCVAAFNKLRLTPRLLAGDASALGALRTSIRFELLVAGFIFAATATLTTTAGPPALV